MDDLLGHAKTPEDLYYILAKLLPVLLKSGLRMDPVKLQISFGMMDFLGHILVDGRHFPNPSKVTPILDLARPRNVKDVMKYIGVFAYFHTYIPHFSELCRPLNKLKRKDEPWNWTPQCEAAFWQLKRALVKATCLYNARSDPECPFIVLSDASDTTLSSCLLQWAESIMHPVSFNSRLLNARERRNFCTYQKELLALIEAYERYNMYIMDHRTVSYSDNQGVVSVVNVKEPSARILRWIARLAPYSHIPLKY